VRKIQADVKVLLSDLRKTTTIQVWKKDLVDLVRNIVDFYFRESRAKILSGGVGLDAIEDLDGHMQKLLEATHKRTSTSVYINIAKDIGRELLRIEKIVIMSRPKTDKGISIGNVDRAIIDTLSKIVPSAALSYEQALLDLESRTRLSWRGPATDLREALRECLDHLAPDKAVEAQENFKREKDTSGPTMKQKVRFVLSSRKLSGNIVKTAEDTVDLIETSIASFVRSVYGRANISTHTPTKKFEVCRIRDLVRFSLCEILSIQYD
jgi:hypothetical protein